MDGKKKELNWNDQLLEQPTPIPIHTANCRPSTTTPLYKDQDSDGRATSQVQQAFNSEQPNPIPTEINISRAPSTTTPIYKGQDSDGRATNQVEQAFNLEEFMTLESLECTAESLEFLATIDYTDGVEVLKDIRACTPIQALKAAANLLPEPLRKRIAEMVRSMNTPIETKPTSKEKPDIVTPHLPQVTKTDKPPTPALSKEEEAFAEWSQLHKLIEVANEFLMPIAKSLPEQAIEKIKHLLTFIPSKAVGLAAGTLTGEIRDIIEQLLLGFNIAIG